MNLTQITSADLKRIVTLLEQKETLRAQIAQLDAELAGFHSGEPATPAAPAAGKPGRTPDRPAIAKTGGRGAMKAAIIELLTAAGTAGLSVQEIAARLKAKPGNIHVWFSSTGRTVKEIKKLGPGKYGWTATSEPGVVPAAAEELPPLCRRAPLLEAAPAVATKADNPVVQPAPAPEPSVKRSGATKDDILNWLRAPENWASRRIWVAGKLGVKP
jgi:hypothetical protein